MPPAGTEERLEQNPMHSLQLSKVEKNLIQEVREQKDIHHRHLLQLLQSAPHLHANQEDSGLPGLDLVKDTFSRLKADFIDLEERERWIESLKGGRSVGDRTEFEIEASELEAHASRLSSEASDCLEETIRSLEIELDKLSVEKTAVLEVFHGLENKTSELEELHSMEANDSKDSDERLLVEHQEKSLDGLKEAFFSLERAEQTLRQELEAATQQAKKYVERTKEITREIGGLQSSLSTQESKVELRDRWYEIAQLAKALTGITNISVEGQLMTMDMHIKAPSSHVDSSLKLEFPWSSDDNIKMGVCDNTQVSLHIKSLRAAVSRLNQNVGGYGPR